MISASVAHFGVKVCTAMGITTDEEVVSMEVDAERKAIVVTVADHSFFCEQCGQPQHERTTRQVVWHLG